MWGAQQGWSQWSMQPAMFNDVPHDQIDWAELAKQWIQMQQAQPTSESGAVPPVQVPPQPAVVHPQPPAHTPVILEELPPVSAPLLKTPGPPGSMPEPFQPERPFEPEPGGFGPKPVNDAFWPKSQWESTGSGDRGWPAHNLEPAPPLIGGKETFDYGHMHDNPPLAMQSIDYNHMSEFSYNHVPQVYVPPEAPYEQYWSQVNAAPPIAPMFLKKHRSNTSSSSHRNTEEESSQLDAAKRKQLPAWIREGLEKMEQERIKKIEKERAEKEKAEKLAKEKHKSAMSLKEGTDSLVPEKSKFDSDSEGEEKPDIGKSAPTASSPVRKRSPSPVDVRTEEEKRQEFILTLRRLLTEILLDVTNSEMEAIAEEVLKKEKLKKLKAQQLASTTSLSTKASALRGLASYDTGSEASEAEEEEKDSSDSEEELYRIIREKKKQFALKGKKILAEIERKEIEEQKEALKQNNDPSIPSEIEVAELEGSAENSLKSIVKEEKESIQFLVPTADQTDEPAEKSVDEANSKTSVVAENDLKNADKGSHTSDSSSSSSESESSDKEKGKSHKNGSAKKVSKRSKVKSSKKRRSKSSESDSSGRHRRSRSRERTSKQKSSSKKKKRKRSASSSSSSETARKKKHSSKSEASYNHHRRSSSYDEKDRKHRRSASPRSHHSSKDSYRSRDSHHRHDREKYSRRDSYYESKRSPSPHRRSSKLPKKYRSSRSPSSDRESSRKYKRSREY